MSAKKQTLSKNARIYRMGGGWGNAINLSGEWNTKSNSQRVVGWKTPMPVKGDALYVPMQSGRTAVHVFTKVEPCGDPADMFFAEVDAVDYLDEMKNPPLEEPICDSLGGYKAKEAKEAFYGLRSMLRKHLSP